MIAGRDNMHCVESGVDDIRDMGHLGVYENMCSEFFHG